MIFAGSNQPEFRDFDITEVTVGGNLVSVSTRTLLKTPFCTLTEFARLASAGEREVLVVPPLSGHFSILLRDLVVGILPTFRVFVMNWTNVRFVPIEHGAFGFEANISCVMKMIRQLQPRPTVIALCQGGVPALAATALLGACSDQRTHSALVLIAAPVDPLANPTRVTRLLRERTLDWFGHLDDNLLAHEIWLAARFEHNRTYVVPKPNSRREIAAL